MFFIAICDAHYNFTAIDIGEYGSNNGCGVLLNSRMHKKFEQNFFNIFPPETLDGLDKTIPSFLVGHNISSHKVPNAPSCRKAVDR